MSDRSGGYSGKSTLPTKGAGHAHAGGLDLAARTDCKECKPVYEKYPVSYTHLDVYKRQELSKAQEATVNAEKFMNVVPRHTSFEELTPTLLRELVEKIVVHVCSSDENKTRIQDIEIYYAFVGKVDLPE